MKKRIKFYYFDGRVREIKIQDLTTGELPPTMIDLGGDDPVTFDLCHHNTGEPYYRER